MGGVTCVAAGGCALGACLCRLHLGLLLGDGWVSLGELEVPGADERSRALVLVKNGLFLGACESDDPDICGAAANEDARALAGSRSAGQDVVDQENVAALEHGIGARAKAEGTAQVAAAFAAGEHEGAFG